MEGKWVEARKLIGEIQKKGIRKDKENYLQEKCTMLEEHKKRKNKRITSTDKRNNRKTECK
jgi:hypothetical protein